MLAEAGLDLTRLDVQGTWHVFKEFAAQPVEPTVGDADDDMLMFESGIYDWSDGKGSRFNWGLCRQFALYDADGEYDHMEQLRCDLFFEPTPALEQMGADTSMWPSGSFDDWVLEVERLDGHGAVFGSTPVESRVEQGHV
jgi:hypothetical protein